MEDYPDKKGTYRKELYTEEARHDRFRKIAERRVNRILEGLRLLGNTGNRTLYLYTDDEIDKVFETIEDRLLETRGKFKTKRSNEKFRL